MFEVIWDCKKAKNCDLGFGYVTGLLELQASAQGSILGAWSPGGWLVNSRWLVVSIFILSFFPNIGFRWFKVNWKINSNDYNSIRNCNFQIQIFFMLEMRCNLWLRIWSMVCGHFNTPLTSNWISCVIYDFLGHLWGLWLLQGLYNQHVDSSTLIITQLF